MGLSGKKKRRQYGRERERRNCGGGENELP